MGALLEIERGNGMLERGCVLVGDRTAGVQPPCERHERTPHKKKWTSSYKSCFPAGLISRGATRALNVLECGVVVEGQYGDVPAIRLAILGGLIAGPAVYPNHRVMLMCPFATVSNTPPYTQLEPVLFGTGWTGLALVVQMLLGDEKGANA